jgi:hemerythrin superfamily protein
MADQTRKGADDASEGSGLTGAVMSALGMLGTGSEDALTLLKHDHREVDGLFKEYEGLDERSDARRRREIVTEVCALLTVHATIEEELFYPAVQRAGNEARDLIDEARVEHRTLKELIATIQGAAGDDRAVKANFTVLREYVQHHVKEEEDEVFDAAKDADVDLDRLGQQLEERKLELMTQVATEVATGRS